MSPHLPTGKRKIPVATKNEVMTQLREMALSPKLVSMAGNAMFMDDIKNVPINDVMETVINVDSCFFDQDIFFTYTNPNTLNNWRQFFGLFLLTVQDQLSL